MNLTTEQKEFLAHHKIDERFIFDASGIRHKDYGIIMKNIGLFFAIGVTPCEKGGHTLRNRKGQCIQCNTANIAFMLRSGKNAHVYVVGSIKGQVLKVGFAKDINDRLEHLIGDKYGGLNDWKLLYSGKYNDALKFESLIHNSLSNVHYHIEYNYYGKNIISNELFRCSFDKIKNIIEKNKSQFGKVIDEFVLVKAFEEYNFIEESKKILSQKNVKNEFKLCPYCNEEIQKLANKCKHCGEWLNKIESTSEGENIKKSLIESEKKLKLYGNALDKLGEHEILGPLNAKLLKGEDINIEEYLKDNYEVNEGDYGIYNKISSLDELDSMDWQMALRDLQDKGYFDEDVFDKEAKFMTNGLNNGDESIIDKYNNLSKILELKENGVLEEEEFINELNKLLNINKIFNNSLNFNLGNFLFSSKGKISRLQYVLGIILLYFFLTTLGRVMFLLGMLFGTDNVYIDTIILFVSFIFPVLTIFYIFIIINVKRLHDLNKNGIWLLAPIYSIPISSFYKGNGGNEYNKKINKLLIFMIISFSILGVILGILFPSIK